MADFNTIWSRVLKDEGGYQTDTEDSGNYCENKLIGTKYGIAAINYKAYYGYCPTIQQMKDLTEAQAKAIWKKTVWDNIQGDKIDSMGIASMILDAAGGGKSGYLHVRQAINKSLNKNAVSETYTMKISENEASLINSIDEKKFLDVFYGIRKNFLMNNSLYWKYGTGWINRLNRVYNESISLVKKFVTENKKTVAFTTVIGVTLIVLGVYFYIQKKKK